MKPEIVHCPDGHYQLTIYSIRPYIADYPEQALLSFIVQGWCPKSILLLLFIILLLTKVPYVLSLWVNQMLKVDVELANSLIY